jgi:5'(3')-deoxyribonucleotidase
MRFKIDIDNVIRDMSGQMVTVYNSVYKNKLKSKFTKNDIKDYDVNISFPLCENKARKFFFDTNAYVVYMCAKPMKDATNGLQKLRNMGHEIILVSYQPTKESKEYTLTWLQRWNIPYDALVFTNNEDKTIVPADYIIDDNPKFLDMDNAKKVCIDWPYNRGRDYDFRVKSINDFVNKFETAENV